MGNDITVEQILADMERFIEAPEEIEPGDVTVKDIIDRFHCGKEKARIIMDKMAASGGYRVLKAGAERKIVLRKITD